MKLRGIRFSPVFNASGARGFFGEGYWYTHHWLWLRLGLNWSYTTFVSKTTTLNPREGNMPRKEDFTPRERRPRCIATNPWNGHALNAVGLSNPGAYELLDANRPDRWQTHINPFLISFMALDDPTISHIDQVRRFRDLLGLHQPHFQTKFGVQFNRSCPNVEHAYDTIEETHEMLDILGELGVPIVVKFNPVESVEFIKETAIHPACDAVANNNTIPWEKVPEFVQKATFGSTVSPLTRRGFKQPGGLSGPECLQAALDQVKRLKDMGVEKPIITGNGIQSVEDVDRAKRVGASGIEIGTVAMVRPWRMRGIIYRGLELFKV